MVKNYSTKRILVIEGVEHVSITHIHPKEELKFVTKQLNKYKANWKWKKHNDNEFEVCIPKKEHDLINKYFTAETKGDSPLTLDEFMEKHKKKEVTNA